MTLSPYTRTREGEAYHLSSGPQFCWLGLCVRKCPQKGDCTKAGRRRARVTHARRQRQEEDRQRKCDPCAEPSHTTAVPVHRGMRYLFRRPLLGLGMAVFALALLSAAACLSTGPEEASFLAKSNAAMTRMMAGMKIKPSHDVDRDFVAMMVPHHQGAIDMAKAELSYGHNEPLLGLAQEIIVTQEQEIAVMRRALGESLLASVPSSHQPSSSSMHLLSYHWTPRQSTYATGGLT